LSSLLKFVAAPLSLVSLAGLVSLAASGAAIAGTSGIAMDRTVQTRLVPQLEGLVTRLAAERDQMQLGGVRVLEASDKFLPGKIALGISDLVDAHRRTDPTAIKKDLAAFNSLADLTVGMDNHTWGIYYYLLALRKLQAAGLLDQAVPAATLERLKHQLDWRTFVRVPEYTLIDLPTNYYGVAFGVARLRFLLGWEDEAGSTRLLTELMAHYRRYSGTYGFSDETDGEGRFDRYSILLVAEICERFMETGMPVTDELKGMLRRSVDIALMMANPRGEGFSYGRSLGPYGDTAALEILTAASSLGVLTPDEQVHAYAYSSAIAARYADFWVNPATQSVDMWDQGRATDGYRARNRILGENFSLLHQLMAANQRWDERGFKDRAPAADLQRWVARSQPASRLVWFAKGDDERALVLHRDKETLFSLPFINGGSGQYDNSPYYALPFAHGLVAGTPDSGAAQPQLLPKLELDDGTRLLPAAYFKGVQTHAADGSFIATVHQDALARLGEKKPARDSRVQVDTTYRFEAGKVVRIDRFSARDVRKVTKLTIDFASFSDQPRQDGLATEFDSGRVTRFEVSGLDKCEAHPASDRERSPDGPMKTHIHCEKLDFELSAPLTVTWTLSYH
jgi:hypothetical protein